MKLHQKIFVLIVVLALTVVSLGLVVGIQGVPAAGFAQISTGVSQVVAAGGSNSELAYILSSTLTKPGMMPNVSWNG